MAVIDTRRLDEVERRWLAGAPTRDIERECAAAFRCTRRAVRKYLAIVRRKLAAHAATVDPAEQRTRIEALLLNAYRVAELGHPERGANPAAMVAAAHRLAELHGVLAPQKLEHSGAIATDPDALLARVQAAAARAGRAADAGAVPGAPSGGPRGGGAGGG